MLHCTEIDPKWVKKEKKKKEKESEQTMGLLFPPTLHFFSPKFIVVKELGHTGSAGGKGLANKHA